MSTTLLNLRRRQNRRPPVPRRVFVFIALLAVGAAGLTFVVVRLPSISVSHTVPWPVVALAMLLAQLAPVRLNTENHTVDVDLFGIPMVVGAVFTSPADLMISVGLSSFVNSLIRRQYPERSVFNVVNMLIGAALARLALAAVLGTAKPEQLLGLEAVCLAILAFEGWTSLGVLGAVSLSSGAPGWPTSGLYLFSWRSPCRSTPSSG